MRLRVGRPFSFQSAVRPFTDWGPTVIDPGVQRSFVRGLGALVWRSRTVKYWWGTNSGLGSEEYGLFAVFPGRAMDLSFLPNGRRLRIDPVVTQILP
ncbi:MAG: hypothetical protein IPN23_11275 [Elusimicrobia bacterium]|nr:hypothetical protein [Elusimicrobiota bacterium]